MAGKGEQSFDRARYTAQVDYSWGARRHVLRSQNTKDVKNKTL